jgi:hypothetical protein
MEERDWKPQQPSEVEDNYLYPSQESSRWGSTKPGISGLGVRSLRCHPESPACKGRSLRLPGAKTSESPDSFFKDSWEATEACTTWVKTEFGRHPDSPVCKGRSLRPWCTNLRVSGVLFQRLWGGNRGLHHSGQNQVWEARFFGRSLRSRVKVSGLYRPESPALRPGVSAQKIPNSRISAEFSQPYCKGV